MFMKEVKVMKKYEIKKKNKNEIKENRYFIQKKIILNNIK